MSEAKKKSGLNNRDGIHWKVVRIALGIVLAILGVLGLVLPILQGLLFLVASVFVLSIDVPVFRRLRKWLARKYPAVFETVENWFEGKRVGPDGKPLPPPTPLDKARTWIQVGLVAGGLGLATVCVFYMDSWLDEALYLHYGRELWQGANIYDSGAGGSYLPMMFVYFGGLQAYLGPSFYLARIQALATTAFAWLVIWWAVGRLGYRWAGIVATAFFVTNLGIVAWFTTASPYCLVFALVALTLLFLARDWQRPVNTICFLVGLALVCWTRRNLIPASALAFGVYVWLHPRRRALVVPLAVLVVVSLAVAFLLAPRLGQMLVSAMLPPQISSSPLVAGQTAAGEVWASVKLYLRFYGAILVAFLTTTVLGAAWLWRRGRDALGQPRERFALVVGTLAWGLVVTHLVGPLRWDPGVIRVYFNYAAPLVCLVIGIGIEHLAMRLWPEAVAPLGAKRLPPHPAPGEHTGGVSPEGHSRRNPWEGPTRNHMGPSGTGSTPRSRYALGVPLGVLLAINAVAHVPTKWTPDGKPTLPRLAAFAKTLREEIQPEDRIFWLVWSRPNPLVVAGLTTLPPLYNDSFSYSIPDKKRTVGLSWNRFIGRAWLAEWATVCVVSQRALERYGEKAPGFFRYLKDTLADGYVKARTIESGWPTDYGPFTIYRRKAARTRPSVVQDASP